MKCPACEQRRARPDTTSVSREIRRMVLKMIHSAGGGHTGGSLSAADILAVLYFRIMNVGPDTAGDPGRDRFILSKGHSVESLYCALSLAGFFPESVIESYGREGSILAGHPTNKVKGVELNSGALGHGLSVGAGMALAGKMDHLDYRVYVLMGDGEQAEGSIYEAAVFASHHKLDNLVAIIDRNRLQISGSTEDIISLEPLKGRWESFGWHVLEVDGHNHIALESVFEKAKEVKGKPVLIIAHTVKGKGVSFIENDCKWHHGVPDKDQLGLALKELI